MAHTLIMCVWQAFCCCCCCCFWAMPSILHFPHVSCHWIIIFLRHSLSFVGTIFIASICFPGHLSSHHLWLMSRAMWTTVWIATFLQIHLTDTHMTRDSLRYSRGNNIICNCETDNIPILHLPLSKAVASFYIKWWYSSDRSNRNDKNPRGNWEVSHDFVFSATNIIIIMIEALVLLLQLLLLLLAFSFLCPTNNWQTEWLNKWRWTNIAT